MLLFLRCWWQGCHADVNAGSRHWVLNVVLTSRGRSVVTHPWGNTATSASFVTPSIPVISGDISLDKALCTSSVYCTGLPDSAYDRKIGLKIRIENQDKRPRDVILNARKPTPTQNAVESGDERRDAIKNDDGKRTPTHWSQEESSDAVRHDPCKTTPSVATSVIVIPTPNVEFGVGEPREATRHDLR